MWVAFPLSPLPPVHPRVKEIQSREPKVAEHEVERKRERKEEQKKNKERENSFGKRRGFPRMHLSHLVKRAESVFLSPPPFFPTYLAHCRRLMGFRRGKRGSFLLSFPSLVGSSDVLLCVILSPLPLPSPPFVGVSGTNPFRPTEIRHA